MILDNKKTALLILIAVFFVSLDRFLKIIAIKNIFVEPIKILGEILKFNLSSNYNIAFSLPVGGKIIPYFILFVLISFIICFFSLFKANKYLESVLVFFIILGASSNLLDRIKYGFVVDYLDLKYFTVFNIADAMIVAGVFSLIFFYWKKNQK